MPAKRFVEPLDTILVFGATGHIGGPFARWTRKAHPEVRMKLATSQPIKAAELRAEYPYAEIVDCSYYDPGQLRAAMKDVERLTPLSKPSPASTSGLRHLRT